jgi:hypothetical protein
MKKSDGRPPSFSYPIMRIIGEMSSGEMTLRNTSRIYGVSHGAVSAWKKKFASHSGKVKLPRRQIRLPRELDEVKESMEREIREFMCELSDLDEDLLTIRRHQRILFGK